MANPSSPANEPTEIEAEAVAPLSKVDQILLENFAQDIVNQATRLDDLAKQLITLFIGIPAVYGVILKLINGDQAIIAHSQLTILAFAAWLLALAFSLVSLLPRQRKVDPESLSDIQNYFSHSARRKYILLSCACSCGFIGISLAILGS